MSFKKVPSHRTEFWDHDLETYKSMSLRSNTSVIKELATDPVAVGKVVQPTVWGFISRLEPVPLRRTSSPDNAGCVDQGRRRVFDRGQIPPL